MAKKKQYVCRDCGSVSSKWVGFCENCGGWNTFEEETLEFLTKVSNSSLKLGLQLNKNETKNCATTLDYVDFDEQKRFVVDLQQFNNLLGGGLVQGSLNLIGGCPGIGKSTLLLQVCASLCKENKVLYVSGEENRGQIKLRAERLKVKSSNLFVMSEFDMSIIVSEIEKLKPAVVVVDSIQTVSLAQISSSCGSVVQVKQCTYVLQKVAKEKNIAVIVVGHVNKEGNIAGPKVLEHIVDVVLSFEGEPKFAYRILKVVKNRFGPSNEIAVFEMMKEGLVSVLNPSSMLLSERPQGACGSCVCCAVESSKPIFVEMQSIVTKTHLAIPRRVCMGFDYGKLVLMIAVLEKRLGLKFNYFDCYVNVVGGLKFDNVSSYDLALALSLISSLKNIPIGDDVVAFGEVGLAGEVRSVCGFEKAVQEAQKLGFKRIFLPKSCAKKLKPLNYDVKIIAVGSVKEAMFFCFNKKVNEHD